MTDQFTPTNPQFPNVHIQLTGRDGNAYAILGAVQNALKSGGHGDAVEAYMEAAMSGDYDHLLQVSMCTVSCS